jgi:hypothetical protein
MVEVKLHRDHPASMAERVQKRRANSGDTAHANTVTRGDKDTFTNVHNTRNQQYGEGHPGEGDIRGHKRGVV